jgi:putative ABC transport system permease protein
MGQSIGSALLVEGRPAAPEERPEVEYRIATPSYFPTMGIALRSGRLFDARDASERAPVALINQTAARTFWPGTDPVGKRIKLGPEPERKPWITIAGVVADVRHFGLDADARPEVYQPFARSPLFAPILVVRTATAPAPMVRRLSAAIASAVPGLPVYDVSLMRELVARSTAQRRFMMGLLAAFAAAALLLAALGVYGIAAQAVAQRTREIGLRMALGASPTAALRLVLADGLRSILPGLAAGAGAAAGLTRAMRGALFAVSPLDPLSFGAAALVLAAIALLACYAPARRATRVDPLVALRHD